MVSAAMCVVESVPPLIISEAMFLVDSAYRCCFVVFVPATRSRDRVWFHFAWLNGDSVKMKRIPTLVSLLTSDAMLDFSPASQCARRAHPGIFRMPLWIFAISRDN